MRIDWWITSATPVESHRTERTELPVPEPAPVVGRRWGKASAFSWSAEKRRLRRNSPGVTIEMPEGKGPAEFMRVSEADLKIKATRVTRQSGQNVVEIDRMERVLFHYTEHPPKRNRTSPQGTRTTYYDLEFALHPEDES